MLIILKVHYGAWPVKHHNIKSSNPIATLTTDASKNSFTLFSEIELLYTMLFLVSIIDRLIFVIKVDCIVILEISKSALVYLRGLKIKLAEVAIIRWDIID